MDELNEGVTGGMVDATPEEIDARIAELDAQMAALTAQKGGTAADPLDPAAAKEAADPTQPKAFKPVKQEGATAGEIKADYAGIQVEGVDYLVPQVDKALAASAAEKAAKGEELTDMEKAAIQDAEFSKALGELGFDWDALTVEYHANGGNLSKGSYDRLCASFGKALVDGHMQGVNAQYAAFTGGLKGMSEQQQAKAAEAQAAAEEDARVSLEVVTKAAGGEAELAELNEWVKTNVPADELTAVNELLASADMSTASGRMAVEATVARLAAKMKATEGYQQKMVTPSGLPQGGSGDGAPLSKEAYQHIVLNDKRYEKDKLFTRQVEQRRLLGLRAGI